ncbi:MAG: hypothetical protein IKG56_01155, partial [Clostridia bacterium]|nr:hypothetical protein [Clostridia bacterium]
MNKNIIKRYIILCLVAILITIFNYVYAAESVILGDINRDGKVDSMDLLYIMRHIIAESSEEHKDWLLEGERLKIADITENG